MEKRILIALIIGLSHCLTTFAIPQRGILHMQQHPAKDPKKSTVHVKILKQINSVNDDGSYTFGYEADDGSFKVETRSKDGVVKGKYGFIDPNGQLKTVEYTAGEKSTGSGRDSKESDLSMASATDTKATLSKAPSNNDDSNSSSEETVEENDVGTFNSFGSHLRAQESPQAQNQYPRQVTQGQYFREVNPGTGNAGSGGGRGSGEQDYRGVRPGVGLSGVQLGGGVNPGLQFQRQQFADERQFDDRQPQFGGQFRGQQFSPQQFGQQGVGVGAGNPQLAQGGFGNLQQQQQQRPFLFPQQGPFIGSQGPFPNQQAFGAGGNPQFQQQQFGPQQSFRQPFGLGGLQTSPQAGNRFNVRPGQVQQPQQFNDGFNDPQFDGPGFGFDGQQGNFDVIGPFGLGGGVNGLNQFGIQQQNPLLSNQLGGFNGANGAGIGGVGTGAGFNRNPTATGVRVNPSGDSGLRPRPSNVDGANSQEYVPSVELDGFSEDADQDGFVDRFPGSGEGSDKKAAQTEEKTPAVKTPDGRQVNEDEPVQYRPQILGPQQQRPQGLRPGFQQQQPQLPINQFGGISQYDEDQLNQLYLQLGQQNGRFRPQFIAGSPQAQFQGGLSPNNPQFLGGGGPPFLQQNFQGQQQRPFLGGGQSGFPQQQSVAGLQNQQPQQQLLNPGQGQSSSGRIPGVSAVSAAGAGPVTGLEQFQTVNDGTGIQEQYQPQILTGPAGQAQFAQAPNYQTGAGFGGGPPIGFQYPGFNPYTFGPGDSPYGPYSGFGGPQQFQQQQPFINPQQLQQQQQFLGQSPQRGPQSLLGQQQSQTQSQQPQSQQILGQGSQQLSLGGIVNGGGGGERRERDGGSNEDKKTN